MVEIDKSHRHSFYDEKYRHLIYITNLHFSRVILFDASIRQFNSRLSTYNLL